MEQRVLGSNGPSITTIGFGAWAIGGVTKEGSANHWGPQDEQDSIRSVHAALDAGVNWFDTAADYGLGHSEEVLGRALGSKRKDVIVATKFGMEWDEAGKITDDSRYETVIRACDASLQRLGTDYIDLYLQHWPDGLGTPVAETMRALDDLIKAGKVRYTGVSNFDAPLLKRVLSVRHIDSVEEEYSVFHREVEAEILPICRKHGVGVLAFSPLASGLLGGRYTPSQTFVQGDWRSRSRDFTGEGLRRNLAKVDRLKAIAQRHDKTVAQLAIAWVLSNPAVTSAIVGVRRPDHILGALPAADWHMDEALRQEIQSAVTGTAASPA